MSIDPLVVVSGMSRSGTTLLATIVDSHPAVSMAYELLPGALPALPALVAALDEAIAAGDGTARRTGNLLKESGAAAFGVFVKRASRALVEPPVLLEILRDLRSDETIDLDTVDGRLRVALAIVERKMAMEGTRAGGLKAPPATAKKLLADTPGARVLGVLRDPRDIVASHRERGFEQTPAEIARTWNETRSALRDMERRCPPHVLIVRYEDLVTEPSPFVERACRVLGVPFDECMLRFFESKASVHREGQRHANAENLSRDFFSTSVGRWRDELGEDVVRTVERTCGSGMQDEGYRREFETAGPPLVERVRAWGGRVRRLVRR